MLSDRESRKKLERACLLRAVNHSDEEKDLYQFRLFDRVLREYQKFAMFPVDSDKKMLEDMLHAADLIAKSNFCEAVTVNKSGAPVDKKLFPDKSHSGKSHSLPLVYH